SSTAGRSSDSRARTARRRGSTPSGRRFPAADVCGPVLMTAVVPAYRCGTVPDSHRVPSCDVGAMPTNQLHFHPTLATRVQGAAVSAAKRTQIALGGAGPSRGAPLEMGPHALPGVVV